MKKQDLKVGEEYLLWTGKGSFGLPNNIDRAARVMRNVWRAKLLKVGVSDPEKADWPIVPRENGLLFSCHEHDTGIVTGEGPDGEKWRKDTRGLIMTWAEFEEKNLELKRELSQRAEQQKREEEQESTFGEAARAWLRKNNIDPDNIYPQCTVEVDVTDYDAHPEWKSAGFQGYVTFDFNDKEAYKRLMAAFLS